MNGYNIPASPISYGVLSISQVCHTRDARSEGLKSPSPKQAAFNMLLPKKPSFEVQKQTKKPKYFQVERYMDKSNRKKVEIRSQVGPAQKRSSISGERSNTSLAPPGKEHEVGAGASQTGGCRTWELAWNSEVMGGPSYRQKAKKKKKRKEEDWKVTLEKLVSRIPAGAVPEGGGTWCSSKLIRPAICRGKVRSPGRRLCAQNGMAPSCQT